MGIQRDLHGYKGAPEVGLPGPTHSVRARFVTPPPQFDGCFTTFYHLELDVADGGVVEDHLQPEWANLRFFGGGRPSTWIEGVELADARFTATGPSSRPCRFQLGTSRMWGIGFLPLGWARFIEGEAVELANAVLDGSRHPAFAKFDCMSDVLCDPTIDPEEQLGVIYETMERLMRPSRDEAKISKVHAALVSGEHIVVSDLASTCAMSIRTLERVCHRYFGFSPKQLLRRQRFMRSLANFMLHQAHGSGRWTEAMDEEYHDQAQFTREFTEFMTMTPSKYAALDHPILASFMDARARIYGAAAQTLDLPRRGADDKWPRG